MENGSRTNEELCRVSFRDGRLASRKAEEAGLPFHPPPFHSYSLNHLCSSKENRGEAASWLESIVGPLGLPLEPTEKEFVSCLRSGIVLCNAINRIQPGAVPKCCSFCLREGDCDHRHKLEAQEKELMELKELLSETRVQFITLQTQLQNDFTELGRQVIACHCIKMDSNVYNKQENLLHPRFSLPSGKARTARYIPVRQLIGTRTGGCRLRKKKGRGRGRRKKKRRRRGEVPCPHALAARGRLFCPRALVARGRLFCPRALVARGLPASVAARGSRVTFLPARCHGQQCKQSVR
ncbi:hypothetical protein GW17_00016109 [Ensete ventricosum]|nr:hypothetical protein GW17_00016109 [Ensete ventricosum]